ncbi:MAG: hypothetical protein IKF90_01620, partial [Parasporobacterium sp.]|nr:hypothetical protein [Parasporobacterium sp.]
MSDNNSPQNNRQTNKAVIVIAIGGFFALTGLRAWDQHYVMFFLGLFIAVYGLFMLESNESKSQNNNQDEIHNGANNTSEFNTTTGYDNDEKIEITVNIDNDVHANKSTGPLQKEGVI